MKRIKIAVASLIILLLSGAFVYHKIEGWSYLDAFYFTGMTMTTVGFGDLHPTHAASKLFTVFFAFAGVGLSLFVLTALAARYVNGADKLFSRKKKK